MELATGPLPSRAPDATPTEDRGDPWSQFLRRVLVSVGVGADKAATPEPGDVLPLSVATAGDGGDLLAD